MDIKALSIQVQAKGVQQAANALGNLAKNAAQLDPVLTRAKAGLDTISKVSLGSTNAQIKGTAESIQYLRNSTKEFSNIGQGFKGLSNSLTSVSTAIEKMVASTQGLVNFNVQLQQLKNTLSEMKGMSTVLSGIATAATGASARTGGGGGGSRYPVDEAEKYAKVQQRLLQNLEREAVVATQGKIAWLEQQAAKKGVSEQAAPFIAQLKAANTRMYEGKEVTKQYAAALRMVPAQFTDIATQLAGGQSPMLILMQQGGQLKDMFGSVGGAAKAAGGYILNLLKNPLVLAASAAAAAAYAFYSVANSVESLGQSFILTGGYIGITRDNMYKLATTMDGVQGSSASVVEAFNAIAASGKITGSNVENLAKVTANFARVSGSEIEKVVAEYASLSKKPAEALISLNEKYHFLTASVYEQVRALEAQGETMRATELAQNALSAAQEDMTRKLIANAGFVSKAWMSVKDVFSDITTAIGNIGRTDEVDRYKSALQDLVEAKAAYNKVEGSGTAFEKIYKARVTDAQNEVNAIGKRIAVKQQEEKQDADNAKAREQSLSNQRALEELVAKGKSKSLQLEEERAKINKTYNDAEARAAAGDVVAKQYIERYSRAQALADLEERMRVKAETGGIDRLASLKAEQMAIEADIEAIRSFGTSYDKTTENAKKLFAIQEKLRSSSIGGKDRSELEAERNVLVQITNQEKLRNDMQEDVKGAKKWEELADKSRAATAGIQEHIAALRSGEEQTSSMTEAQKLLAQAEEEADYGLNALTRSAAANTVAVLQNQVAIEKQSASLANANKIKQETAVLDQQGNATLAQMIEQYQFEANSINLSNRERQTAQQLMQIEAQRKQALAPLQAQMNQLTREGSSATQEEIAALQAKIDKINELAGKQSSLTSAEGNKPKPVEGSSIGQDAEVGFKNFYDSLETRQSQFQEFYSNSYSLMSDTLGNFFTTGKLDAKSFFADMASMVAKMIAQMLVLKAVRAAATAMGYADGSTFDGSSSSGAGGTTVAGFANGGSFGSMTNKVYNKPTPFKFAAGGTFQQGVLGEGRKPEGVLPLARTSSGELGVQTTGGGGGSSSVVIQVNVTNDSATTTTTSSEGQDAKMIGQALAAKIKDVIAQEKRPGGLLAS